MIKFMKTLLLQSSVTFHSAFLVFGDNQDAFFKMFQLFSKICVKGLHFAEFVITDRCLALKHCKCSECNTSNTMGLIHETCVNKYIYVYKVNSE